MLNIQLDKTIRGRSLDGHPNPVDIYVGHQLKVERKRQRMSQTELAELLGLTFQQIQKYEAGQNRIGASRLWDMAQVLNVSVDYFFDGLSKKKTGGKNIPLSDKEATLLAYYKKINDPKVAKTILNLVQSIAKSSK